jgi:hypothetical protein
MEINELCFIALDKFQGTEEEWSSDLLQRSPLAQRNDLDPILF